MLVLVRHGITAANAQGKLLGRSDPPLSPEGRRQAAALADSLGGPTRVVSSPLRRCTETAAAFGLPVEVDARWLELDYGDLDQQPIASVPAEVWQQWRSDPAFRPPGGAETLAEVSARVAEACEELAGVAADADVVVVSHVSPIKAAVAWALGVGPEVAWRTFLDVASVTRVGIGPRGPSLRSFNETHHARPAGPGGGEWRVWSEV